MQSPEGDNMNLNRMLVLALLVALSSSCAFAQKNTVATWNIDLAESNFGSGPPPRSMTSEILIDTPQMLSYRAQRVNSDGSSFGWEWSGPKDGSVRHSRIVGSSCDTGLEGLREVKGALIWHGIELDGSIFRARSVISTDGTKMTFDVEWIHYDDTVERQRWVFRRAPNTMP